MINTELIINIIFNRTLNLDIIPQYAKYLTKKGINGILGKFVITKYVNCDYKIITSQLSNIFGCS